MASESKTQHNFDRGVEFKATTSTASCASSEKGEATKAQENFNWTHERCREDNASYPDTTPQKNFPNGS